MANFRDIYIKSEEDPGFRPDQVEVYDELEAVLQQIKMTLFTNTGEVLGEPDFGLQVEKYLFEFSINPFLLTNEATSQINKFVSLARKKDIKISPALYKDDRANRDIFVLLIDVKELNN